MSGLEKTSSKKKSKGKKKEGGEKNEKREKKKHRLKENVDDSYLIDHKDLEYNEVCV